MTEHKVGEIGRVIRQGLSEEVTVSLVTDSMEMDSRGRKSPAEETAGAQAQRWERARCVLGRDDMPACGGAGLV